MKLVDLTYKISPTGSKYPSDPVPVMDITPAGFDPDGRLKSAITSLQIRPHHGTHVDAPAHKIPGGKTIEKYPLGRFINSAFLLGIAEFADDEDMHAFGNSNGPGYVRKVTARCLERSLKEWYDNSCRAIVIRTGYDRIIEEGVQDDINFPYLEEDAAKLLADLSLNMVAIDSFSVDPKGSKKSPAHTALLKEECLIAETLVNLHVLEAVAGNRRFWLYTTPVIIEGADAAPARVHAEVEI